MVRLSSSLYPRLKIILLIVLGLVSVIGVFLMGICIGNIRKIDFQSAAIQPTNTPTLMPSGHADLVNSKEYNNLKWGIFFQYPTTWSVEEKVDLILVCPKDYAVNQESAKECFTIKKEDRSLSRYISDLEQKVGYEINIDGSNIRHAQGNRIYHIYKEGNQNVAGFSISYITNLTDDGGFVIESATPWNDYGYHLEPFILDTFAYTFSKVNQKTYSNSKYGFSFEYPKNWKIIDNASSPEIFIDGPPVHNKGEMRLFTINIFIKPKDDYIKEDEVCIPSFSRCWKKVITRTLDLPNIKGFVLDPPIPIPGGYSTTHAVRVIIIEKGNNVFVINQERIVEKEDEFLTPLNKILSTFTLLK